MATITKRPTGYFVRVRKVGFPTVSRTFKTLAAARAFARDTESAMDHGAWIKPPDASLTTVDQVIDRFIAEVDSVRPFGRSKLHSLQVTSRAFKGVKVQDLTPQDVMEFGKGRRAEIAKSTLQQQLTFFAQAIDMGRTLWGLELKDNPVRAAMKVMAQLSMTGGSRKRDRRVQPGEIERILAEAPKGHWIVPIVLIAVECGMRQKEIAELHWEDISFERKTILIRDRKHPTEKEGNHQLIPLLPAVEALLRAEREVSKGVGKVFPVENASSVSDRFARTCKRAGVEGLRFHDLRHEAISRMFERGMSIPEVAAISGHRTWTQLKRYTNLKPLDLISAFERGNPDTQPPQG